jgi:hypothetical protein
MRQKKTAGRARRAGADFSFAPTQERLDDSSVERIKKGDEYGKKMYGSLEAFTVFRRLRRFVGYRSGLS